MWEIHCNVLNTSFWDCKRPDGKPCPEGIRGIAARCALAKLNARGRNPMLPSSTGEPHPTCVFVRKIGNKVIGDCQMSSQLALCYHCHQPLCPDHRILIGKAKQTQGKRLGGATCQCLDMKSCQWRQTEQMKLLSAAQFAGWQHAHGTTREHDVKESASFTSKKGRDAPGTKDQQESKGSASTMSKVGTDEQGAKSASAMGTVGTHAHGTKRKRDVTDAPGTKGKGSASATGTVGTGAQGTRWPRDAQESVLPRGTYQRGRDKHDQQTKGGQRGWYDSPKQQQGYCGQQRKGGQRGWKQQPGAWGSCDVAGAW